MTKKALYIFLAVLILVILCLLSSIGFMVLKGYINIPVLASAPACEPTNVAVPAVEIPIAPVVICDPSTVVFTDMGELDPTVVTTINVPAIYEWWTGGSNEGVQRVGEGSVITIHGVAGHWWTLPNQAGLDCAWDLHVANYGAKPQHEGKTYDQLVVPPPAEYLK